MSDKTFQWSIIALAALVVLWMVLGIVFGIMNWGLVMLLGLIVEIVGGGVLLRYWGRSYMARE